jgi:hypothetical protein
LFQAQAALAMREDAPELAIRMLTDLVEAYPDDAPTLRIIGRVLAGWGRRDLAARRTDGTDQHRVRRRVAAPPRRRRRTHRSVSGAAGRGDVGLELTGFGPEIYTIPHLDKGTYKIILQTYAEDATRVMQESLAHVIVWTRGERRDFFVALTVKDDKRVVATVTNE